MAFQSLLEPLLSRVSFHEKSADRWDPSQGIASIPPYFYHRNDLDNFILVYTMGKVASTALVRSLEAVGVVCRHLQWMRPETEAFIEKFDQDEPNSIFRALNAFNRARAYCAFRNREYAGLVKVITAIRAPIELILSHTLFGFDVIEWYGGVSGKPVNSQSVIEYILEGVQFYLARPNWTLADLTEKISPNNRHLISFHWAVYNYMTWFDRELLPFFPCSILAGQMTNGYQIAKNVMILKFEELGTNGEQTLAAYAQRPQFKMLKDNVGGDKVYGEIYREVLQTIKFPRAFVDHLCDSKYVRHFYSEDERQAQKQRWIG